MSSKLSSETAPASSAAAAQSDKPSSLIDKFGRRVDYIRLSVTDRCDFRCVYCMTEEMTFLPRAQVLSLEELYTVGKAFVDLGVKKIRLTGGEPMVRTDVMSLIERLGALPGLEELLLTTNGAQLDKYAVPLKQAGLKRINISIDSLDAERFKRISRVGKLDKVLQGIDAAIAAGFDRIKLNSVIMRGYNEDEVLALAGYALQRGIDIAFIEEMPLGEASDHEREQTTCSNAWVRQRLEQRYELTESDAKTAGPSRYFDVAGFDARIAFISPVSHNFCGDCNRVRVTVEGRLLLCLGNEHSMDLRKILRSDDFSEAALQEAIVAAMDLKPERHYFYEKDHAQPVRLMNMTGG